MTDNASPKGWIVRVTFVRPGGTPTQIYDVAIQDAAEAVAAVRRECGAGLGDIVETIGQLPDGTDLRAGEVFLR